jgi:hypothetical protein
MTKSKEVLEGMAEALKIVQKIRAALPLPHSNREAEHYQTRVGILNRVLQDLRAQAALPAEQPVAEIGIGLVGPLFRGLTPSGKVLPKGIHSLYTHSSAEDVRDAALEEAAKALDGEVAHIKDNSTGLRKWDGMEHEARSRELGAMYVKECADMLRDMRSDSYLNRLNAALSAAKEQG